MRNVTTLLFDLGGVLIELGPVHSLVISHSVDPEQVWQGWTSSQAVRRFESGRCNEFEFALAMIEEFDLVDTPEIFLQRFAAWPKRTFTGATELLSELGSNFRLCCLSNTNSYHYARFLRHQPIMDCFDRVWLSHQTGILKPEPEAFAQVIEELGLAPHEILFLDDNPGNIAAAQQSGMIAEQVNALDGINHALERHGLST